MAETFLLLGAVLLGAFIQGATGIGFGLFVMSVLPFVMDVRTAVPLVAALGLVACLSVLVRWRAFLQPSEFLPLLGGVVVGTPLGVLFLTHVDDRWVKGTLGLVLVAYAGLALRRERDARTDPGPPPRLLSRAWGPPAGFLGGVLGGAFNTGGPPVVLYATARHWSAGSFRANLQVAFVTNTVIQLVLLARAGLFGPRILRLDAVALPAMILGLVLGTKAGARLDGPRFRRVILTLLAAMGVAFLVRVWLA